MTGVWNATTVGRPNRVAANSSPIARTSELIRLLEADPELGTLLAPARRAEAERDLIVRTHRLSVGPWDVSRLSGASADHVGLLVLDGVLARELVVADHVSAELLGPGDLVRPWQPAIRRSPRRCSTASASGPSASPQRRRSRSSRASTAG